MAVILDIGSCTGKPVNNGMYQTGHPGMADEPDTKGNECSGHCKIQYTTVPSSGVERRLSDIAVN
jgi:hypothetical protein